MKVFTKDRVKKDNHNMSKKRSSQTKLWNLYARRGCPNCSVPRAGEFRNLGFKVKQIILKTNFPQLSVDAGSTSTIGLKSSELFFRHRMNHIMNW